MHPGHRITREVALTIVAIALTVGTIGARPAFKDKHRGWQGNATTPSDWLKCYDKDAPKPTAIPLSTTYTRNNPSSIPSTLVIHNSAQIAELYRSAFAQCFMEDSDEKHPPKGGERQYEDGARGDFTLRVRPVAHIHEIMASRIPDGHGMFVADYHVTTKKQGSSNRPLGNVAVDHSALLWLGRDNSGQIYVAVLDLENFPSKATSTGVSVLSVGSWLEKPASVKYAAAFARLTDPEHSIMAHESTWLSCDPGCCLASDIDVQ